ncbi:unnamed protein product, partial [Brassica napus]
ALYKPVTWLIYILFLLLSLFIFFFYWQEIIELRESIEEMTETMKKQQEILLTMAGTMKNLPVKETPKEKSTIKRECALARDYQPNNKHTIPSMRVCSYCRRNALKPINKNFNGYLCGVRHRQLPLRRYGL